MFELLATAFRRIDEFVTGAALCAALYILGQEMVARWVFNYSFTWTEDLSRVLLVVLVYFGASAVASEDRHIRVGFLLESMPAKVSRYLRLIIDLACLGFCVIAVWLGARLVHDTAAIGLSFAHSGFALPVWVAQSCIPISFAIASVRIAARILSGSRRIESQTVASEEG